MKGRLAANRHSQDAKCIIIKRQIWRKGIFTPCTLMSLISDFRWGNNLLKSMQTQSLSSSSPLWDLTFSSYWCLLCVHIMCNLTESAGSEWGMTASAGEEFQMEVYERLVRAPCQLKQPGGCGSGWELPPDERDHLSKHPGAKLNPAPLLLTANIGRGHLNHRAPGQKFIEVRGVHHIRAVGGEENWQTHVFRLQCWLCVCVSLRCGHD